MNTWGKAGETEALSYLKQNGYRWVVSNYLSRWGEVDLVVEDGQTLVFVEVKKRTSFLYGRPEDAVTPWKMKKMERAAVEFLQNFGIKGKMVRFDVIAIDPDGLRHFKNAFSASRSYY